MTDFSVLQAIDGDVRQLLTERFRRGDDVALETAPAVRRAVLDREVRLAPVQAVVEEAMRKFVGVPARSDAWLGPRLHATLRLTRREAADRSIWAWIDVLAFPNYVRWRWPPKTDGTPIPFDRFIGDDSRSGLKRLWWASEITRNGADYSTADQSFSVQPFDLWQRSAFMHHKACALAAVGFLACFEGRGVTHAQSIAMVKAMNVAVRTTSLDALAPSPATDGDAVRAWVREPVDETTMMVDLPVGPDEALVAPASIAAARGFIEDIAARIQLERVKNRDGQPALEDDG